MKNIYTIISYYEGEQGWHDRCGDYHPGKDSSIDMQYFTDIVKASEYLAQQKMKEDTQNTLLINGIDIDYLNHDEFDSDFIKKMEYDYWQIDKLEWEFREKLIQLKKEKEEQEKLKKEQEKKAKELLQKKQTEDLEKQQLAKLLAKYGG